MEKRPSKEKAIRRVKAAIEMLVAAADNLPIDSTIRCQITIRRCDLEDLLVVMEQK